MSGLLIRTAAIAAACAGILSYAGFSVASTVSGADDSLYHNCTFENGADGWTGRGSAAVETVSDVLHSGSSSLFVSGRTDAWNGASIAIGDTVFKPGKSYCFHISVMQNAGASEDFAMTLQYSTGSGMGMGMNSYAEIARTTAKKGEWTTLENTSFTIPENASDLQLYIETPENLVDFYIDDFIAKDAGEISGSVTGFSRGDVNHDTKVNASDCAAFQKYMLGADSNCFEDTMDINSDNKINLLDFCMLKDMILKKAQEPPVTDPPVTQPPQTDPPVTQPTTPPVQQGDPKAYMESIRSSLKETEPSSADTKSSNVDYGTIEKKTYFSTTANRNKNVNIILPAGYNKSEKYPVLYILHGIFGDQNSMLDDGMKVQTIIGNLTASGEAEKMIIVCPSMYTSKTKEQCSGFTVEDTQAYDNFLYDLTDDLMPYMEKNYSIKIGRENTAITGFSMGGREALYIGISRPDVFGYIGGACPAPGIVEATDSFMHHPGCMPESDFRINDTANSPYVLMITGAQNDPVVGTFPNQYHELLTKNGTDHIWQVIAAGDHGGNSVRPHLYNYAKAIFKCK